MAEKVLAQTKVEVITHTATWYYDDETGELLRVEIENGGQRPITFRHKRRGERNYKSATVGRGRRVIDLRGYGRIRTVTDEIGTYEHWPEGFEYAFET